MAEASGGQENQEISPIKAPVQTENSADKEQRLLNDDLWKHMVEGVSLKDSPHVVEQVD